MKTIFDTTVVATGPQAQTMVETANMLILFGAGAPANLAEYCFLIGSHELPEPVQAGDILQIDEAEYPITAVGDVVAQNLANLGHISITLDGAPSAAMPGTMHVEAKEKPALHEGSRLRVVRN